MTAYAITSRDNPRLPDTGELCCYGVAVYGPQRCTCWEPVYDLEQAEPVPAPMGQRKRMCADCAFRKGSPERRGDESYAHAGEVDDLPFERGFACHQGMRRVVKLVHPSGMEIAGHPADYRPPIEKGVPYKADGSPADMCAGFCAVQRREGLA